MQYFYGSYLRGSSSVRAAPIVEKMEKLTHNVICSHESIGRPKRSLGKRKH